jgi:hypothetical protein
MWFPGRQQNALKSETQFWRTFFLTPQIIKHEKREDVDFAGLVHGYALFNLRDDT